MSDNGPVRGNEFIRRIQAIAKERRLACVWMRSVAKEAM
jgi:hypothetical protein